MDLIDDCPYEYVHSVDVNSLYEELFLLREKVFTLEKDNFDLRNTVSNIKTMKEQLEEALFNNLPNTNDEKQTQQKKTRKYTNKSIDELQALNFYRKNKDNPSIVCKLKTDLKSIGYEDNPPWQLVKKECLKRFAMLSEEEKMQHIK